MENKSLNVDTCNRIRAIEEIYTEGLEDLRQTIHDINRLRILDNTPVNHLTVQKNNLLNSWGELETLAVEYIMLTGQRAVPPAYEACKSCTGTIGRLFDAAIEKQENKNMCSIESGDPGYFSWNVLRPELIDILFKAN